MNKPENMTPEEVREEIKNIKKRMAERTLLEKDLVCAECESYSWNVENNLPHCGEGRPITKGMKECAILGKKEKCHYCLSDDFKEEVGEFRVLIEGELKRVHKQCYNRHLAGESNIRLVIR